MEQSPKGGQQLLWGIVIFCVSLLLWAAFAYVDEFTRGEGKVIPSSHLQVVQNLEGGIIAELYVQEGQVVKKGQPLLRIDDTLFSSSLREADVTEEQLQGKVARLKAEAEELPLTRENLSGLSPDIVAQEVELYQSRQRELESNLQVLRKQVNQREQELQELRAKRDQLQRSLQLLTSELEMTRPLAAEGAISEVELLRLERQVNDLLGELTGAKIGIPRAQSSLEEAREKLSNAAFTFRSEAQQQYSEARSELSRLKQTSGALQDRVQRTLVTSPVTGTVKQVLVKTIGGVVQPGMDMVEIVPNDDRLQVEAKVRPADIAFLHPGQAAMVKFTAYDFSVHGGLEGNVVQISPDTIMDEEGNSFYLVRVETTSAFLGQAQEPLPIIPGMTVSVDILTGKKTVLDYLLKPILKTKQLALRER